MAREFLEDAIKLRQRLKPRGERDFADASIGIMQEVPRSFEPEAGNVDHEIDARDLLELLAQMIWTDIDRARHPGEGEFTGWILVDEIPGLPDFDRFSAILLRHGQRTVLGPKVV